MILYVPHSNGETPVIVLDAHAYHSLRGRGECPPRISRRPTWSTTRILVAFERHAGQRERPRQLAGTYG